MEGPSGGVEGAEAAGVGDGVRESLGYNALIWPPPKYTVKTAKVHIYTSDLEGCCGEDVLFWTSDLAEIFWVVHIIPIPRVVEVEGWLRQYLDDWC